MTWKPNHFISEQPRANMSHTTVKKFLLMMKELLDYDGESGTRPLTDWELNLIENLGSKVDEPNPTFSIKQAAKLEQIWQEVFG